MSFPSPSVFGLMIAVECFPGRSILLCGDNMGARQALSRGSCKTDLGRSLCAVFWTVAAAFSSPVWIEEVAGVLNPSDFPSRDCVWCEKPLKCDAKRCEVPCVLKRILFSRSSVNLAQFSIPSGNSGFTHAWPCPDKTV